MSGDAIGDAELFVVCVHEHAHLAVARHFGACGFVNVVRFARAGAADRYAGRFRLFGELADDEWRIVALAGVVAELLCRDAGIDAAVAKRLLDEDEALLAGIDRELATSFTDEDMATCLAIVRGAWTSIRDDARTQASELAAKWAVSGDAAG